MSEPDCTVCEQCDGRFGADPFPVTVVKRGKTWRVDYCSAVCGLLAVRRIGIADDFISVTLGPMDAYDFGALQHALKEFQ